jgi:hypothetical protein
MVMPLQALRAALPGLMSHVLWAACCRSASQTCVEPLYVGLFSFLLQVLLDALPGLVLAALAC